jgi:hypothetical protein
MHISGPDALPRAASDIGDLWKDVLQPTIVFGAARLLKKRVCSSLSQFRAVPPTSTGLMATPNVAQGCGAAEIAAGTT